MDAQQIATIVDSITHSKKYRQVYRPTIERIVKDVARRYPAKFVGDESKKLLHRMWGASWRSEKHEHLKEIIDEAHSFAHPFEQEAHLLKVLAAHASTAERTSILNDFYHRIFTHLGSISSIVDYACGLNPVTVPWMSINAHVHYHARDIDLTTIEIANYFFQCFEYPYTAVAGDLLHKDYNHAHAAFLFKVLPVLEQQEKGSSVRIIQELPSRWIVVSFPVRSYGGHEKGMESFYTDWFDDNIGSQFASTRYDFSTELVFIIDKHPA